MIPLSALLVLAVFCCLLYIHFSFRWSKIYRQTERMFPGPKPLPIIGNGLIFGNPEDSYDTLTEFSKIYNRFYRIFMGNKVFIVVYDYRDVERLLSSNTVMEKNSLYKFFWPWIGTGLLTSTGNKWKAHRRMITPAFHFKILESYVDLFNMNGSLLCEKLTLKVGQGPFDVHPIIKLYALDNICETAMQIKVNALVNSESAYVRALKDLTEVLIIRTYKVWLYNTTIFNHSRFGKMQKNALDVIHSTTKNVIKERRKELLQQRAKSSADEKTENDFNQKTRTAFLDVLLMSTECSALSDEEICEEVSTFMFEGHDTISSGISFALCCLSKNQEVQVRFILEFFHSNSDPLKMSTVEIGDMACVESAYQEQLSIFGKSDREPTWSDFQDMKYLEMVLKESQRLYPSVPMIGRVIPEDFPLDGGYVLPKGAEVTLFIARLHRDPKVWPNPDIFNPENFLPEAIAKRNPYAYVPFSAGPRNCIGQRFAMLEMKSCISKLLRKFKILPSEDDVKIYNELVLLSTNGVKIQLECR